MRLFVDVHVHVGVLLPPFIFFGGSTLFPLPSLPLAEWISVPALITYSHHRVALDFQKKCSTISVMLDEANFLYSTVRLWRDLFRFWIVESHSSIYVYQNKISTNDKENQTLQLHKKPLQYIQYWIYSHLVLFWCQHLTITNSEIFDGQMIDGITLVLAQQFIFLNKCSIGLG